MMLKNKKLIVKKRADSRRYLQILKKRRRIKEIQGAEKRRRFDEIEALKHGLHKYCK